MFTDRDLVMMIEIAKEVRSVIRSNRRDKRPDFTGLDPQAVDDLTGFILAQNEAFPDSDEDDDDALDAIECEACGHSTVATEGQICKCEECGALLTTDA